MEEGGKVWLLVFSPKKDNAFLAKMNLLYDTELYDIYEVLDEDGKHFPPSHQQRRHQKRIPLLRSIPHWLAPYPWKMEKAYCKVWLPVFSPKVGNTILAKMKSLYDTELCVKKIWMYMAYTSLFSSPTVPAYKKKSTQSCQMMPHIKMVVDLIEHSNTINEEADENIEPPAKHSLELEDEEVITFVSTFKHKIVD